MRICLPVLVAALALTCARPEALPTSTPGGRSPAAPTGTRVGAQTGPSVTAARTPRPPATAGPDGSPPGYATSCAAAFPWGQQVTRGFVCIEPPFGVGRSAAGALTTVSVQGYAGGSFENNVVVDLVEVAPDGSVGAPIVRKALTYTAPEVGMPGAWSMTLDVPSPPATGRLRVIAHFESPRDGSRVAEAVLDLP